MDPDGGSVRNLTRDPANDFSPEWSPDGSRIAFRTDRGGNHEIYVMASDGSDPVNLTRSDAEERSPAWSPDGTRIAFSSDRDGERDIYVMDPDGTDVVRLPVPGDDEYPTWSPDGKRIAFTNYCTTCTSASLMVMDADGRGPEQLVPGAGWPDWSPSGNLIAFDASAPAGVSVFVIRPHVGAEPSFVTRGLQADWAPDGNRIVYAVESGTLGPGANTLTADLYIARSDGRRIQPLTDTPSIFEFEPTWQP
jgi:Tol biopolymer transport system component